MLYSDTSYPVANSVSRSSNGSNLILTVKVTVPSLQPNTILRGPVLPEPVQVFVVTNRGPGMQIIWRGLNPIRSMTAS
jgi:hypothetical protein